MNLSVIIPVHNGGDDFRRCLQALTNSIRTPDELIVVDDSSSDLSADLARGFGARVLATDTVPHGPASSRNKGAASAHGDVLVFIDADVAVRTNTLSLIEKYLLEQPEISALFGSYDDAPPKDGFVSRYKNLQHHYVHQHSPREASTFWAGCGAIRREAFLKVGGFDERYKRPSVEDIELGLRLFNSGHRIWLCPEVQATHLKRWNVRTWLRSDILDRAIPWSQLIFSSSHLPSGLNLDDKSRWSALAVWMCLVFLTLGLRIHWLWGASALTAAAFILLNRDLYRFFYRRAGLRFALGSMGLHALYYIYSSLTFAVVMSWLFFERLSQKIGLSAPSKSHIAEEPEHER